MSQDRRLRLGDMLVEAGLISEEQLGSALSSQKASGRKLGQELVALGFLTEVQMTQVLSNQLSVPWVSLYHVELTRELLTLLPAQVAESCGAIPVYVRKVRNQGDTLFVAMDDPTNAQALKLLEDATGLPVKPMVAASSELQDAIRVYYFGGKPRPAATPAKTDEKKPPPPPPTAKGEPPQTEPQAEPKAEPQAEPKAEPKVEPRAEPNVEPKVDSTTAEAKKPEPKRGPRTITLTLLDGTTVKLPAPGTGAKSGEAHSGVTTGDVIAALRARARGDDVSKILPDQRWEELLAALLTVLLRKGLVADWEFVEEWNKRRES
jgi:type IV pilus assembly protein PilB